MKIHQGISKIIPLLERGLRQAQNLTRLRSASRRTAYPVLLNLGTLA